MDNAAIDIYEDFPFKSKKQVQREKQAKVFQKVEPLGDSEWFVYKVDSEK